MSDETITKNSFSSDLASADTYLEMTNKKLEEMWKAEVINLRTDEIESYTERLKKMKSKISNSQSWINKWEKINEYRKSI